MEPDPRRPRLTFARSFPMELESPARLYAIALAVVRPAILSDHEVAVEGWISAPVAEAKAKTKTLAKGRSPRSMA